MPRPGPSVTSGADLQPGSDSLFPSGFTGGGARPSAGSVGTGELADGSVSGADLNLASVATALSARSEFSGTYAQQRTASINGNLAVVTGDSLSDLTGVLGSVATTGGGSHGATWFNRMCMISGQRIQWAGSLAVAGSTTAQWLATQIPQALAMSPKPSACFIQIGTNDTGPSFSLTTWSAMIRSGVTQLLAAGIVPILCLTPPRGTVGAPTTTNNISKQVRQMHLWLMAYARSMGLFCLDNYSPVVDPTGGIKSGWNTDQTHLQEIGFRAQAIDAITRQQVHLRFPPAGLLTCKDAGDAWNLFGTIGLFATTAGLTATGTASTIAAVAPSAGDYLSGNWYQVTRAASSTGNTDITTTSSILGTASAGDVIRFTGRIQTSGWDTAPGGTYVLMARWWTGVNTYLPIMLDHGLDTTDGVFLADFTMPTGATALDFRLTIKGPIGAANAVVVRIGELTAYNLTQMGLVGVA